MRNLFIFAIIICAHVAHASTFVGNGGNAGDVELQVAINQIQATLQVISKKQDPEMRLCTCYQYTERPVCNQLARLSSEQVNYCAKVLQEKSGELLNILRDSSQLHFNWTSENIEVQEKSGLRGSDAVTNPKKRLITLNQENFVSMNPSDRIFLLTHELFHLVDLNGSLLADDKEYPPFKGDSGGRQFINSMASAVVIESYDYASLEAFGRPLQRSKSVSRNWLSASYFGSQNAVDGQSTYGLASSAGIEVSYRYQVNQWGVLASFSGTNAKKGILSATQLEETRSSVGLGAAYRLFPFGEPLTTLGQSHFVFAGKVELLKGKFKANDSFLTLEDEANSTSFSLSADYLLPFQNGIWGSVHAAYAAHRLNYEQFNLKYSPNTFSLGLGAIYAF